MHSPSTRHQFLKLRSQGLSLSSISRQLSVSKPTLIKWNRELQQDLSAATNRIHEAEVASVAASAETEATALRRRITAVNQELFSRSIRDLPTPLLEALLGKLNEKLRSLSPIAEPGSVMRDSPHDHVAAEVMRRTSAPETSASASQQLRSTTEDHHSHPVEPNRTQNFYAA